MLTMERLTLADVKGRLEKAHKKVKAATPKGREPRDVEIRLRIAATAREPQTPGGFTKLIDHVEVFVAQ